MDGEYFWEDAKNTGTVICSLKWVLGSVDNLGRILCDQRSHPEVCENSFALILCELNKALSTEQAALGRRIE